MSKTLRLRFTPFLLLFLLFATAMVQAGTDTNSFTFTDLQGNPFKLEDYRGKWVVVNYWATWCPPCLEEIPELVHFHDTHKDTDAVVIGINMEEKDTQSLVKFVDENLVSYPVVPMSDDMPLLGSIQGLPTTYLLDPSGKPAAVRVGRITEEMIEAFMAKYTGDR